MKKQSLQGLAAKSLLTCCLVAGFGLVSQPASAGIPVIDATNLSQNIVTALETVAQYEQQIQQYTTQLQQYENMLTNTAALPQQTWSQVQGTIGGMTQTMQGLQNMINSAGSIQAYVNKFDNTSSYENKPCFNGTSCTAADIAGIQDTNATANAGVKAAADSQLEALEKQQTSLSTDAANVQQLQSSAAGANGQKAALDAANQLAASQANQLVQIRALLIAAQTAQAAQLEQQNAREAQQQAATRQATSGTYTLGTGQSW